MNAAVRITLNGFIVAVIISFYIFTNCELYHAMIQYAAAMPSAIPGMSSRLFDDKHTKAFAYFFAITVIHGFFG